MKPAKDYLSIYDIEEYNGFKRSKIAFVLISITLARVPLGIIGLCIYLISQIF